MRQILKLVCVCAPVCLCALLRLHFLIDFHQNCHRHKKTPK